MFKKLALAALLSLWSAGAWAQNTTCATRANGDNSNACASTAFVWNAFAGGSSLALASGQILIGQSSGFALGVIPSGAVSLTNAGIFSINLGAGATVTGNLPVGNLNSGTGANANSYWSGAGTWTVPSQPLLNAVTQCGADPTGIADSAPGINACLVSGNGVALPIGTYLIGCTGGGNGISIANGQSLIGAAKFGVKLIYNCTTGNAINLTGATQVTIGDFFLARTSGTPTAGAGLGYTGNISADTSTIYNIQIIDQWDGFDLPPAGFARLENLQAWYNYNNGFTFIPNTAAGGTSFQYQVTNISSESNNGYGYYLNTTGFTGSGTFLSWDQVDTFANTKGGIYFQGTSSASINDWRVTNLNISSDNGDCIYLQSYGGSNQFIGGLVEQCGTVVSGRTGGTPATNIGNGFNLKNNVDMQVTGISVVLAANHGIVTDGTNTRLNILGDTLTANGVATTNTYDDIHIASGSEAVNIIGNQAIGSAYNRYGINNGSTAAIVSDNTTIGQTAGCLLASGTQGVANNGTGCIAATSFSNIPYYNTVDIIVNFNSANTDNAITIPTIPNSAYNIASVGIYGCTGAITSATFGMYSATGAGGLNVISTTTGTITASTVNTAANYQGVGPPAAFWLNYSTLYFRTIAAQGSAVTCKVQLRIVAL